MVSNNLQENREEIERLVLQVQQGDQDAFAKIYDFFIDPIYRYVFYRVKDEEAEDLVETVFLKVWENIRQYKPGKKSFSAWIFRIAHNLVVDHYRASSNETRVELDENLPSHERQHNPISVAENVLHQHNLKKALKGLSKKYQDVIVYKFINELSNEEIARIMNKTEGSIRILQFRALKALRRELTELGVKYEG